METQNTYYENLNTVDHTQKTKYTKTYLLDTSIQSHWGKSQKAHMREGESRVELTTTSIKPLIQTVFTQKLPVKEGKFFSGV